MAYPPTGRLKQQPAFANVGSASWDEPARWSAGLAGEPARTTPAATNEALDPGQCPVGGMFELWPFSLSRLRRFAVCFSLIVLPFFLMFALVLESLDMIEPP